MNNYKASQTLILIVSVTKVHDVLYLILVYCIHTFTFTFIHSPLLKFDWTKLWDLQE